MLFTPVFERIEILLICQQFCPKQSDWWNFAETGT